MANFIEVHVPGTIRRKPRTFLVNTDHIRALSTGSVDVERGYIELSGDAHSLETMESYAQLIQLVQCCVSDKVIRLTVL